MRQNCYIESKKPSFRIYYKMLILSCNTKHSICKAGAHCHAGDIINDILCLINLIYKFPAHFSQKLIFILDLEEKEGKKLNASSRKQHECHINLF